jgi:hypothetical protein
MVSLVILIIAVAGLVFFLVATKEPPITSYEECAKAGNPIQESYPAACTTKDGKRFINQDQLNFLDIKEWNVRLSVAGKGAQIRYSVSRDNPNQILISSSELDDFVSKNKECLIANQQTTINRSKIEIENSKQIGDYYFYSNESKIAPCIGSDIAKIKKLNDQAYGLRWVLPTYKDIESISTP